VGKRKAKTGWGWVDQRRSLGWFGAGLEHDIDPTEIWGGGGGKKEPQIHEALKKKPRRQPVSKNKIDAITSFDGIEKGIP